MNERKALNANNFDKEFTIVNSNGENIVVNNWYLLILFLFEKI